MKPDAHPPHGATGTSGGSGFPPVRAMRPAAPRLAGFLVAVLAAVVLAPALRAASITVSLDRDTIGLGDTASLKITIEGGTGNETPVIPNVPGLRFTRAGTASRFQFANGRQFVFAELSYIVTAGRVGEFTIGPVIATVGNQRIESDTVTLRVVKADDPAAGRADGLENAAFLLMNLPDRDVYVGESFVAEIWLYAIGGDLLQAPQIQADGFTVGKLHAAGQQSNIQTNNRVYSRARFLQPLTAARAGDLQVQATDCILAIPVTRRQNTTDLFESAFFGFREKRRFNLATEPARVRVRPLPQDNIPPGFTGAVGEFDLTLSASPTTVQAGDPITVRIQVEGQGNFDAVQLPDPLGWDGFRAYAPTANFQTQDPLGLAGSKHFELVVTPESGGLAELPPLAFSFFSPQRQAYRTVRSAPVPLTVRAASPATAALPTLEGVPIETASPELAPIRPHLGVILQPSTPWIHQPWFLALLAAPWAAWAGSRAWHYRRRLSGADHASRRRRQIERRLDEGFAALARLAQAGDSDAFFATLFRVLQELVGARVGQPPSSITEGILDDALPATGVPGETIVALHRLFQVCNQARYAPAVGRVDLDALRQDAAALRHALRRPAA